MPNSSFLGSKSMMVHPDAMPISWYSWYPICAGNLWQPSCLTFSACVKSVSFWALQLSKVLWLVTDFLTEKRRKDNESLIIPDDFLLTKLGYSWYSNTSQYQLSQEICLPESLCYKAPKPWQFLSGQQSILSMQGGPTQNDLLGQSWLCYCAEQSPESMHDGFHEVKHRWI